MPAACVTRWMPGKLTYKDVLKVQPFGNTTAVVDLSGKEVMDYLNAVAKMTCRLRRLSAVCRHQSGDCRWSGRKRQHQGRAARPWARPTAWCINNFIAAGGDGYPKLTAHPSYVDTGYVDADVLRAYITAHSPLKAADFDPGNAVVRR